MFKKIKKNKGKLIIFAASSVATYFMFHAARASAIAERGNANAIGGELLLLLIPLIALIIYDNISLAAKLFHTHKSKGNKKPNKTPIHIVKINSIEVKDK